MARQAEQSVISTAETQDQLAAEWITLQLQGYEVCGEKTISNGVAQVFYRKAPEDEEEQEPGKKGK